MEEIAVGVAMEAHTQVEVVVGQTGGVVRCIIPGTELPTTSSSHLMVL